jgi:hypothetical protein
MCVRYASVTACMMCGVAQVGVRFQPCRHRVVCRDCSSCVNECILCHEVITAKLFDRTGD